MSDAHAAHVAPVTVAWPDPRHPETLAVACPNCGGPAPKAVRLSMVFATPGHPLRHSRVLDCGACKCCFYETQLPPDYQDPDMLTEGRVPFYLQQGAGISLITRPLARCRAGAGSAYLEVGCGFGFGVDYAQHAKGWVARGIDPGEIAVLGARKLNVPIDVRYLSDDEDGLRQSMDVVMASETIEHVPSPGKFVATLHSVLRPGGMLILTTPDAAELNERTPVSSLIGLLSPGLHLIFQTAQSLRALLRAQGFRHVLIEKDGYSLVAFASDRPLNLQNDAGQLREDYRTYLERRSEDQEPDRDLFFAFAGRAMQEAVSDGCFDQARRVRARIDRACIRHFGQDLLSLGACADRFAGLSLEALSGAVPLNLGGLIYADAMIRLEDGQPRSELVDAFDQAAAAADTLLAAVGELAMGDAMSAATARQARAEAALCAAAAGDGGIIDRLAGLAASGPGAPQIPAGLVLRAFVGLVNGGHYDLAKQVRAELMAEGPDWADPDSARLLSPVERDAAYCLSVLEVQGDDPAALDASRRRFARLRRLLEERALLRTPGLYEGTIRGEALAAEKLASDPAAESRLAAQQGPAVAVRGPAAGRPRPVALPYQAECGPVLLCLEHFWREGDGLYVSGWVLAGGAPVESIVITGDDERIAASRVSRPDLAEHYPFVPEGGAGAGFHVYLPCHSGSGVLRAEVLVDGVTHEVVVPMPRAMEIDPATDLAERNGAHVAFERFVAEANQPGRHVLEIGSRVVGSASVGMRAHFPRAARFVGMDIHPSAEVDVVGDVHRLSSLVGRGSFDAIFSVATLEHLAMPWVVAREINRTLRVGGVTYHIAPQTWPIHETPNDFWRFTDEGLKILFGPENGFEVLAAGLAERIRLYPHDRSPANLEMPLAAAYASAYIVARKVFDLEPVVAAAQVEARSLQYPRPG